MNDPRPDLDRLRAAARAQLQDLLPRVAANGIAVTEEGVHRLHAYLDALLDVGRELNLVSRLQLPVVVENHVGPSLLPLRVESTLATAGRAPSLLDVGSGGGFPGAVLAAVRPQWRVVLVDSVAKKARFLEEATASLENVRVIRARVETLAADGFEGTFDLATSRAVSTVDVVWPWVRTLLAVEGELHVYVRGDDAAANSMRAAGVAGRRGDVLAPVTAPWCEGALVRVRRAR